MNFVLIFALTGEFNDYKHGTEVEVDSVFFFVVLVFYPCQVSIVLLTNTQLPNHVAMLHNPPIYLEATDEIHLPFPS